MYETVPVKKTNKVIIAIRWLFGILFLLGGLGSLTSFHIIAGIFYLLASVVSIPPTASVLEEKINFHMSGAVRFLVVFVLIVIAGMTLPHVNTSAAVNNSTNAIAAPPSSASGSEAIIVTPAPTPTPTPVASPTPTPTSDNKGKLDVVTNPSGATVTVDGVSQGLSPIKGSSLDTGTHTVDLYLSGYNAKTLKVDITNANTNTITYDFTPLENPSTTPTTSTSSTSTSIDSQYQDSKWASSGSYWMNVLSTDMTEVSNSATAYDLVSLEDRAGVLNTDSSTALEESKSYSVSPELQSAKDKYESALSDISQSGYYAKMGANELSNGKTEQGTKDLQTSTGYIKSGGSKLNDARTLVNIYNSRK